MEKSLNARQLLDWGSEKTLEYIRNWDRTGYYQDTFTRAFVDSFRNMTFDRWGFLGPDLPATLSLARRAGVEDRRSEDR